MEGDREQVKRDIRVEATIRDVVPKLRGLQDVFRAEGRSGHIPAALVELDAERRAINERWHGECQHEFTTEDSPDGPYEFCVHCGLGGRD